MGKDEERLPISKKEMQDLAMYLEYFWSILIEFDVDYALRNGKWARIFYGGFRLLIKLWVAEVDW